MTGLTKEDTDRVSFGLKKLYEIKDWTFEEYNNARLAELEWLDAQVQAVSSTESDRKLVIFTHHSRTRHERTIGPALARS